MSKEFKEEAISKLLGRKAQIEAENVPTGSALYKGEYITFEYPAKATVYDYRSEDVKKNAKFLEDFSFDIKSPKLVFNMKVVEGGKDLDNLSAVRLREERSYEYKKSEIKIRDTEGVAFYKDGQEAEKSGFFIYSGNTYTFSVTGSNEEELVKLFDAIISSASFSDK